nr:hypothetical protein BSM_02250 [uncultured archaeon]
MGSLYGSLICKHDENVGYDGCKIKKSLTFSIVPESSNHKITQISTNLFLKRKALPKEHLCFSFSTG